MCRKLAISSLEFSVLVAENLATPYHRNIEIDKAALQDCTNNLLVRVANLFLTHALSSLHIVRTTTAGCFDSALASTSKKKVVSEAPYVL